MAFECWISSSSVVFTARLPHIRNWCSDVSLDKKCSRRTGMFESRYSHFIVSFPNIRILTFVLTHEH